jgi:hypothetical protein
MPEEAPPAEEPEPEVKDDQARKSLAFYHGSDIGWLGCSLQLLAVAGAVVVMWYAHTEAMINLGVIGRGDPGDDNAIFIVTKILAIVGGFYGGGLLSRQVARFARIRNWPGQVVVAPEAVTVMGPRNAWVKVFKRDEPAAISLASFTSAPPPNDNSETTKRQYHVYLRIVQGDVAVTLATIMFQHDTPKTVAGRPVELRRAAMTDDYMLSMHKDSFRKVANRLAQIRFGPSGSA